MAIYCVPFINEHNLIDKSLPADLSLVSVFYKEQDGPLGFFIDERSYLLVRPILDGLFWYNVQKHDFIDLSNDFSELEALKVNGVCVRKSSEINSEIEAEQQRRINIKKNVLLRRHGKPELDEGTTLFSSFYNEESRKISSAAIETLWAKTRDFVIVSHAEFGRYLIVPEDSALLKKLIEICEVQNENIYEVDDTSLVPAW